MQEHPAAAAEPDAPVLPRRNFFRWLTAAAGALASVFVAIPVLGYILEPKRWPIQWVPLGKLDEFAVGETRMVMFDNPIRQPWDGITAHTGVFVRNQGTEVDSKNEFLILAVNCAHLGCPVSWFAQSGLFMCPCHGGVYYANGERASGPPPRGLFHCVWRVKDGQLEVQAPHYPTLQDTLDQPA
jgi:Rieske Fe-S protein